MAVSSLRSGAHIWIVGGNGHSSGAVPERTKEANVINYQDCQQMIRVLLRVVVCPILLCFTGVAFPTRDKTKESRSSSLCPLLRKENQASEKQSHL